MKAVYSSSLDLIFEKSLVERISVHLTSEPLSRPFTRRAGAQARACTSPSVVSKAIGREPLGTNVRREHRRWATNVRREHRTLGDKRSRSHAKGGARAHPAQSQVAANLHLPVGVITVQVSYAHQSLTSHGLSVGTSFLPSAMCPG